MAFIGWVERTEAGVAVHFTQPRDVNVRRSSKPEPESTLRPTDPQELKLGDEYDSANSPSDVSTGEAVMKKGVIGVFLTAAFDGVSSSIFAVAAQSKQKCAEEAETHKERAAYKQGGESRFVALDFDILSGRRPSRAG